MIIDFSVRLKRKARITAILVMVVFSLSGDLRADNGCRVRAEGSLVRVETPTLQAVLDHGLLASLVRKADGRELIHASADSQAAIQLVYANGDAVALGGEVGDSFRALQINANLVHLRIESWYGDAVIAVSADQQTGDLVVEPAAYASRPGLRACRWVLACIPSEFELVAPLFQGIRQKLDDPLIAGSRWQWPVGWEAGLAILQAEKGGFWVHCEDNRYRYKSLQIGLPGDARALGFETEAYGPLDASLGAGGLAWRINVYDGSWQEPAGRYRDWLAQAYGLADNRWPAWVREVTLALSWTPTDPGLLDALAKWVNPQRVLLHIPDWRQDAYDENYPTFVAGEEGKKFIEKAIKLGFRAMPHFNSIDMDPTNPAYDYIRDFQYREVDSGKVAGWSWVDNRSRPVPESNATRMRHRRHKTMVKVHPGLTMWRSILAENILPAVEKLSLPAVFLDVSMHSRNLRNALVENITSSEGMKRLTELIGSLKPGLVVAGEGRNEITMQDQAFAQVHLYRSSGSSLEGLERMKPCPISEFLFGKWCRSFGYSGLGGKTADEQMRLKMHLDMGAIPTLTVDSASELENPNPAVKEILRLAAQ